MPKYHVQRSIEIDASPEKTFEVISDYGTWTTWSPWLCAEPGAKVTVSDNSDSVGSLYQWEGELVGQGEIEHVKLEPGVRIEDEIRFIKPFKSVSNVAFDFAPSNGGTRVTWHMQGSLPWFLFWMKPQMEIFIGMDYERGLKMVKELIETGGVQSETIVRDVQPMGPFQMMGVRTKCAMKDIGSSMESCMEMVHERFAKHGLPTDGESMAVYHDFDMKNQIMDYTVGYMLPQARADVPSDLESWSLPECQALRVDHVGSYSHLGNGWSAANQVARYRKLKQSKDGAFELYKNDASSTPPEHLLTEIYLPLR